MQKKPKLGHSSQLLDFIFCFLNLLSNFWKFATKYFQNNHPYVPIDFFLMYVNLELVTFSWSNHSVLEEQSTPKVASTGEK